MPGVLSLSFSHFAHCTNMSLFLTKSHLPIVCRVVLKGPLPFHLLSLDSLHKLARALAAELVMPLGLVHCLKQTPASLY
jgi:hypothetical protein